jgi:hypothetical protein
LSLGIIFKFSRYVPIGKNQSITKLYGTSSHAMSNGSSRPRTRGVDKSSVSSARYEYRKVCLPDADPVEGEQIEEPAACAVEDALMTDERGEAEAK